MNFECSVHPINHKLSTDLVEAYRDIPTPIANDCYGRRNIMDAGIKALDKGMKICGRAVTVLLPPDENLMLHAAIHSAEPGDIVVANTSFDHFSGVWGELMTRAAISRNLGGLVLDGMCRDSDWIRETDFSVFSRGVCARGSQKSGPGHVNIPIACGNVVVNHGDLILGDDDGVMVIPAEDAEALLALCKKKLENEQVRIQQISSGNAKPVWLEPTLKQLGVEQ